MVGTTTKANQVSRYGGFFATMPVTWLEGITAGALVGAFQGLLLAIWLPVVMAMRETRGVSEQAQGEDATLLVILFLPVAACGLSATSAAPAKPHR